MGNFINGIKNAFQPKKVERTNVVFEKVEPIKVEEQTKEPTIIEELDIKADGKDMVYEQILKDNQNKVRVTTSIPEGLSQTGICHNQTDLVEKSKGWDPTSPSYPVVQKWIADGKPSIGNIAIQDGRYLVAVTKKFGEPGDNIDVILENNMIIPCRICDIKDEEHPAENEKIDEWGHLLKMPSGNDAHDIIEWESIVDDNHKTEKDISKWHNIKVREIVNVKEQ